MIPTLEWTDQGVRFLDQTKLPLEETYVLATSYQDVATVIRDMIVRGAPAIGVSAAMGMALGIQNSPSTTVAALSKDVDEMAKVLAATRPTAVNLFWAIERIRVLYYQLVDKQPANLSEAEKIERIREEVRAEALRMYDEDIEACKTMGRFGAELLPKEGTVLTHCNAGALATCGYGTALGVIRAAVEAGHKINVLADETRPYLQGARLTAWELLHDGIQTSVLCDNMSGALMRKGRIQAVIVGSDRIAANGDVANKIGTYSVSVLAKEHGIPFYVAAPWSTVDMATKHGDDIPIEERSAYEVTHSNGKQMTPDGCGIENPAFDVTPAKYVTAIITERGVLYPPYDESMRAMEAAVKAEANGVPA
ncbi:S-methyl-5-thioribose-1-phosphate isomerase [Terriglobus roseus]|uniref:Methylthioribose-1-phosphate isomerase n=1 Tax=Terriglobus roseus TaxID=392734 RepID=A0A1G7JR69_9BACT|nr:S-methyl-5-thioribose-1-phosphate isomerase [Terriglobus roseus]SDF27375.1 methylthioribose-1-phosphate isomerase [Terriglobus roseus]